MNFALTTIGSTGDLQPFLALALGLQQAGHRVRVLSHDLFAERFARAGVDYVSVGAELNEARWTRTWEKLAVAGDNILRQVDVLIDELFLHEAPKHFADCVEGMRGFDAAICHHGDLLGQEAALRLGIPWAGVVLCPGTIRTPRNPPLHAPYLGRFATAAMWKFGSIAMRKSQARVNATLREIGGSRPELSVSDSWSPTLNLVAASPAIARMPPDLPETFTVSGHFRVEEPAYTAPAELTEFIAAGPKPVIVSFGSMAGRGGEETARLLIEAGRLAGERMIIQRGFGQLNASDAPADRVHFAEFMPHDALFPHGSMVIHHGGAGTTAAASRAGRPSIVVPHLADQWYWAASLRRVGIAGKAVTRSQLTPERLATQITRIGQRPEMMINAEAIGVRLRAETGVANAISAIEGWMAKA